MTRLVVLFNLKPGVNVADYEKFAREVDLPIVNALPSVKKFEVLKSHGLFGGGDAPYQYIEIIDVHSLDALGKDVSTEQIQKIAATFREMAEQPLFIVTSDL
ncbi:MAG: REDY-like protein HapK [Gammaproteobacteria bacterium]|nr:REDY-like protein HapK [Gammaproteobacteria bacterium]